MTDITEALAVSFGGSATVAAQSFEGQMKGMSIALDETKESIGAALLPALQALLGIMKPVADFAQEHTNIFLAFAAAIGVIAIAVIAYNVVQKAMAFYTIAAGVAMAAFNLVMYLNPIASVVLAIVAFIAIMVLLYKKFEIVKEVVDTVFKFIKTGVTSSLDFLTSYFTFVLNVYKGIFNEIAKLWNNTIGKLSFKFPSWVPGFGGKGFDVPNIPMLAEGGIVTGPTLAMVGEKGPEAVIPLSKMGGMGGGVTVNVTGGLSTSAEIGQAVVNALRAYNRSAGPANIQVA
jgi:hypothetical protein